MSSQDRRAKSRARRPRVSICVDTAAIRYLLQRGIDTHASSQGSNDDRRTLFFFGGLLVLFSRLYSTALSTSDFINLQPAHYLSGHLAAWWDVGRNCSSFSGVCEHFSGSKDGSKNKNSLWALTRRK